MTLSLNEYANLDACALAELINTQQVAPEAVLTTAIKAIEHTNPTYNAIINRLFDQAKQQLTRHQAGPFKGVPFLLKDAQAHYSGVPTQCGSRMQMPAPPTQDSELVSRYKKAGLIILGKTNLPEFGLSTTTEPKAFGATRNPWNPEHSVGGSSGGSAAAVAAGMTPVAHANDGGGSIRIPAAYCGLVGLKPSRGRNPSGPFMGRVLHGLTAEHVISKSVRDCAALLDISCGADPGAPFYLAKPQDSFFENRKRLNRPLKIAFTNQPVIDIPVLPEIQTAINDTARLCESLGHHVFPIKLQPWSENELFAAWTLFCSDVSALIATLATARGQKPRRRELEVNSLLAYQLGQNIPANALSQSIQTLDLIARRTAQQFKDFDILLTPATPSLPPLLGETQSAGWRTLAMKLLTYLPFHSIHKLIYRPGFVDINLFRSTAFTLLHNISGQPAITLPLAWSDTGLPIGCQFAAGFAQERLLLQLAWQLEQAQPWQTRYRELHQKIY